MKNMSRFHTQSVFNTTLQLIMHIIMPVHDVVIDNAHMPVYPTIHLHYVMSAFAQCKNNTSAAHRTLPLCHLMFSREIYMML